MDEYRSEYGKWKEAERKRERNARIFGWVLMVASAVFMVLVGWFAIIGLVVVFG